MTSGLLPRDLPAFIGREGELARLAGLAADGRVAVIGGTAGVGKTVLAVHAAHQLLPRFSDGQLYADLRGYTVGQPPAEPGAVLGMFLRRLGVTAAQMPTGAGDRSGLLRQLLASRRMLMLLDNAVAEEQVQPLLPKGRSSLVLITSRSTLPGLEVDERIGLDAFDEEEAGALLAGLIGNERAAAEPEAMARVRECCGRLPLALLIAGRLLATRPAWPVARLAGMLADERDQLARLSAGDLQVRAAVEVCCRHLADGDARLFRLLGLIPGPDFGLAAAASLSETGPETTGSMLDRLTLAALVTEDATGRFGLHDLLRLFARQMCQELDDQGSRDAAEARLVGHYVELAELLDACADPELCPEVEQAVGSLPGPGEALRTFETERPGLLAAVGLAERRGWDQQVWRLCDSMGGPLERLGYVDDVLTVEESALAAVRRAGIAPAAEGSALGNLGSVYLELRRFEEAIACYEDALPIFWEVGDRRAEGVTLDGLGIAYRGLRRFDEAAGCFRDALAIFRETSDRHREGLTLTNLGIAYGGLRRFEEEVSCCRDALTIHLETGDLHDLGLPLRNLGLAYYNLERLEDAITCDQDALVIYRQTGDRYGEGLTLSNLGTAYRKLGRFEEAIGCYQGAALAIRAAGDPEQAAQLEQAAADTQARWRRRQRNR